LFFCRKARKERQEKSAVRATFLQESPRHELTDPTTTRYTRRCPSLRTPPTDAALGARSYSECLL
jgi:hypothetical protein